VNLTVWGCFRSLLFVTCRDLYLTKALVPDLEAIPHFRKTLNLVPSHVDAHYNLGLIYSQRERSVIEFKKAQELIPQLKPPEQIPSVDRGAGALPQTVIVA
jgi:hypothetical protein